MHGGCSGLTSLRIQHSHVIDTFTLWDYFGQKFEGGRGLRDLTKICTGRNIQMGHGHDSLEDALATRELAISFMDIIPDA
ncbi:uncharacterized protein HMPREF1541_06799 [Cyphellophora europaea CBS 101466]|uniref:Exonuclease domain-containing protein n=1 Tax=Cyphellophora europaea (strain CBS 101466) TaxID=1220924 RepID=W2RQF8_CYPE1|nr:uncharacterized protein HMPREF1541_06799 [Cyphellophora europaea CBS 101466]ETN38761.1 hypothetical protein HMPREF1541_06799 [Cyphellophora europaea CBS 101466]